ncbi:MAG: HAMP domain-containing protein [Deltaproteobacteria bacterium]|nr:HAMP domain-containing protein [Deltaproteobacteria bacterium]
MSRFGFKIIGAMVLLAIIPLVTSIYLVGQVIQVSNSISAGQLSRLGPSLTHAASAYRALFSARKEALKLQGKLIAHDAALRAALQHLGEGEDASKTLHDRVHEVVTKTAHLTSLRVVGKKGEVLAEARESFSSARWRDLHLSSSIRVVGKGGAFEVRLEMVFLTLRAPFDDFRALGKAQRFAREVTTLRQDLGRFYRTVFLILFGAVVLVAMGAGLFIARRTTRRLSVLVRATRRVAQGDLQTHVDLGSRDEVRELGDAFNEMVAELRESRGRIAYLEKIGAWQEIARRLAHEIKNPLTPIQLAVQQLHRKYSGDDKTFRRTLDDAYDIVSEEVAGLRRLVTAFSSFAKLPTVQPEPVALNSLIDDFQKSHAELGENADVRYVPLERDGVVSVDRMLIKHVLVNLLDNAIQAGEEVGLDRKVHVTIEATANAAREAVTLTIEDDGPGMDEATAARAFDPYYTTKDHGTGLGLAIVKKIILEHQGSIDVASTPGEGTRFTLRLPMVRGAEAKGISG